MNPIVKKSWELGQELSMTRTTVAKNIGVSPTVYQNWVRDLTKPRKKSWTKDSIKEWREC